MLRCADAQLLEEVDHVPIHVPTVLTPSEQNGSSCTKELNAILYAIAYFYLYLANQHFTLRTDSRGLIYLQAFKKPNAKLHAASAVLDELSFDLQHQSASKKNLMGFADMISRAHDDAAPIKERATYKDLKNPVYELLSAPTYMPLEPLSRPCFNGLVKPYLECFYNEHKEEIDNKKMDDICQLNAKPKVGLQLLQEDEQNEEYAMLLEEEQHRQKFNATLFQKAKR